MAATTLVTLGIQFLDAVGIPLAGGHLLGFSAGTLTPKAFYSDESGNVSLGTDIELDSEGRVPSAGLWAIGSYRIRVTDVDGVVIYDMDDVNFYAPYDWSGLTATVADLNQLAGALGTAGVVVASKAVVVDANKDIATFGILGAATLRANTAVRTPQINDANNVAAVTITGVSSQVNAVTLTPATTTNFPQIAASGSDTNIDLKIAGKGTGAVQLSGLKYPVADGTLNQVIRTNGSGTLSFATFAGAKQVVSAVTTAYTSTSSVIPFDNTIPQNTEGTELLTVTLTPSSASSTLYVTFNANISGSTQIQGTAAVFQDSTADAVGVFSRSASTLTMLSIGGTCSFTSGTTSATTIKLRIGVDTGTMYINGLSSGRKYGGINQAILQVVEV